MIYLNILIISTIIVFILDLSGFPQYWQRKIYTWVWNGARDPDKFDFTQVPLIKLFCCSLCQTFWWGVGYLLVSHRFTILNIAYVCLIAFLTPITKDFLIWFKDLLQTIIDKIYTLTVR